MEKVVLKERKVDQSLGIRTTGIREWGRDLETRYNRYEATPYDALTRLFKQYKLTDEHRVVDFGCGRGRVTFYIHHHFNVPVTGVEANDKTFDELLNNEESYRKKMNEQSAPLQFDFALAELYHVNDDDNVFYFFNPFSLKIFRKVINNILQSIKKRQRTVDLVIYYPLPEFTRFLQNKTPFELINRIKAPGDHGKYGEFLIFRISEENG